MNKVLLGDSRQILKSLRSDSVQCVVTSPPYWGLRDYGVSGQMGLEPTIEQYVAGQLELFSEVRRVLKSDGTLWLNLGDSYNAYNGNAGPGSGFSRGAACDTQRPHLESGHGLRNTVLKPKDLCGIPWRVAFALQSSGWYLRQDIIWHKPNPMPESVRDRCTKAHEYIFLLSKSERYYYDSDAIKEPAKEWSGQAANFDRGENPVANHVIPGQTAAQHRKRFPSGWAAGGGDHSAMGHTAPDGKWSKEREQSSARRMIDSVAKARQKGADHDNPFGLTRNKRSVWTITTKGYKEAHEAHFATFPKEIPTLCILAGSRPGDLVLDPFSGSGTVGAVAAELGRSYLGIELNPAYVKLRTEERSVITLPL